MGTKELARRAHASLDTVRPRDFGLSSVPTLTFAVGLLPKPRPADLIHLRVRHMNPVHEFHERQFLDGTRQ
jgi:hypothetical protein